MKTGHLHHDVRPWLIILLTAHSLILMKIYSKE